MKDNKIYYIGFKENCSCKEEACLCLPICETCNKNSCHCYSDNPFWDGTDAAHPAWWRGQKYGFEMALKRFDEWLDGRGLDGISHPNIELIKNKLLQKIK